MKPRWRAARMRFACIGLLFATSAVSRAADLPVLHVPPAISQQDQTWMMRAMTLSEAQQILVNAYFEQYRKEYGESYQVEVANLKSVATAVVEAGEPVDQWERLWDQRRDVVDRLSARDDALWGKLRAILAESQQAGLSRAALRRTRSNASAIRSIRPGVAVDLTILVDELVQNNLAQISHAEMFDDECRLYEREITQLMQIRCDAALRLRRDDKSFFQTFHTVPVGSPEFERARHAQDRLYWNLQRAERRIHDVNANYLNRIMPLLDNDGAKALQRLFRLRCYTNIYPNPYDPEAVVRELLDSLPADNLNRQTLESALDNWIAADERIGALMVQKQLDWMDQLARNRAIEQPAYYEYEAELMRLQSERQTRASELMGIVREYAAANPSKRMSDALEEYDRQVSRHQSRRNGTIYYP